MSQVYHISPRNGRVGICRASVSACPFGGASEHFTSHEEARAHYEKTQAEFTHNTLERDADISATIEEMERRNKPHVSDYEERRASRAKERAAAEAKMLAEQRYSLNPRTSNYEGLDEDYLKSSGMFGSGAMNNYSLNQYNENVAHVKNSDLSMEEKVQLVINERQQLLSVLQQNVNGGGRKEAGAVAEAVYRKIKKKFLFGEAKEIHIREDLSDAKDAEYIDLINRRKAIGFAKHLMNAPYFASVFVDSY